MGSPSSTAVHLKDQLRTDSRRVSVKWFVNPHWSVATAERSPASTGCNLLEAPGLAMPCYAASHAQKESIGHNKQAKLCRTNSSCRRSARGQGGGGVLCEGGVGVALVMNEPTPMLPGMIPYWPFCAEVAPLRVTHSCLSTFSPLLGSYKPQQQSYVVTPLLLLRSTHFGVCSQHTKLWALSCALLLCIMHKPKLPTQTTTNGMVSHDILVAV